MGKGLEHGAEPGDLYVDDAGQVWKVLSYCPAPTVTLERLDPPYEDYSPDTPVQREARYEIHAVGCRNALKFTRLKPVEEL